MRSTRHSEERATSTVRAVLSALSIIGLSGCGVTLPQNPVTVPVPTNATPPVAVEQVSTNTYTIGKWLGPSGADARITPVNIRSVKIGGGKMRLQHDPITWGALTIACIAVQRDGQWVGGKFEWIKGQGQPVKFTENITAHYGGLPDMVEGEPCLVWFMRVERDTSRTATDRSEYFLTEWHQ